MITDQEQTAIAIGVGTGLVAIVVSFIKWALSREIERIGAVSKQHDERLRDLEHNHVDPTALQDLREYIKERVTTLERLIQNNREQDQRSQDQIIEILRGRQ